MRAQITATKALAAILIIFFLTATLAHIHAHTTYDVIDLKKACLFLEHQYVTEIGLLRAAYEPWINDSNKVYINDNILAARALAVCGNKELAAKILNTLNNNYKQYLRTNRHEVLIGEPIDDTPKLRVREVLGTYGNLIILAEIASNEEEALWREYVDWLLLQSANSLIRGDRVRASQLFEKAMSMWDSRGFHDLAYKNSSQYSVYKLAMAVYTYRALGEPPEYRNSISDMLRIISEAQDPDSGGIHTEYIVMDGEPDFGISDVNVETTSIVILSLYSDYPVKIGELANKPMTQPTVSQYTAQGANDNERPQNSSLADEPIPRHPISPLIAVTTVAPALVLVMLIWYRLCRKNRRA